MTLILCNSVSFSESLYHRGVTFFGRIRWFFRSLGLARLLVTWVWRFLVAAGFLCSCSPQRLNLWTWFCFNSRWVWFWGCWFVFHPILFFCWLRLCCLYIFVGLLVVWWLYFNIYWLLFCTFRLGCCTLKFWFWVCEILPVVSLFWS